jgi:TRAP-type C4-dicarboxylate transport system permease small subunit
MSDAGPRQGGGGVSALRLLDGAVEAVGLVGFGVMMVSTLVQVFARYLEVSADWTEELARVVFLASMMLGIALATRRREHIVVDFLFHRLAPRGAAALSAAFDAAILVLLVVWLRGALLLMELNTGAAFVTLPWLSVAALYAVEAFGIALMLLFVLVDLARQARVIGEGSGAP